MPDSSASLTRRWIGPLFAALGFAVLLLLAAWGYTRSGIANPFVKDGLNSPIMMRFGTVSILREALPLYLGTGLLLFCLLIIPLRTGFLGEEGWTRWNGRHGFLITFGLLELVHAWLWWKVPSALWVLPGINALPIGLSLALLLLSGLGAIWLGLRWSKSAMWRKGILLMLGLALAWSAQALPFWMARAELAPQPVHHPVRVVMISLDGLRQDTAVETGLLDYHGYRITNGYTAIPATRMMWSLLWGGDPRAYSLGHVMPGVEELAGKYPYEILRGAKARGLKARFYIDDGGTIGLADRMKEFDQVVEPARGWENFLNSNLAVHLPLYAAWMDTLRVFPTTTPWTPVDLGLRRAVEDGRGSDWVMYHSCLSHQPLFPTREELKGLGRWWMFIPKYMAPLATDPSDALLKHWRPEYNSYGIYRIRTRSILQAWGKVWNELGGDPDYGPSLRIFMSDHGERFYHVADDIQLGGIHGYGLDPWQCRIPLLFDAPGVPTGVDNEHAVSLFRVRDQLAQVLLKDHPLDLAALTAPNEAYMRMYAVDTLAGDPEKSEYRQMDTKEIIEGSRIYPRGSWMMFYKKPIEQRAVDLTVAEATGDEMRVFRPLKKGGARVFYYKGYGQTAVEEISEEDFQKARLRIGKEFLKTWDGKQLDPEPVPVRAEAKKGGS